MSIETSKTETQRRTKKQYPRTELKDFCFQYFHYTYVLPLVILQPLDILFCCFFFPTICFLCFSVFNDSIAIFPSSDILVFSHVQSTNKPIKGIVQFCYSGFIFNSRFFSPDFGSLLEFPSLCLYYPSVLACYLLYQSPQHINHSCFKFLV